MAWLSAGTSNDDLTQQMVTNGVITSSPILQAFRFTDRGDFIQQEYRMQAYLDRPFKQQFIHISAPHMYATVLEALEISEGMAFLNIGSGSGYLSCLAACLLGESGLSHGIDVSRAVVEHSEKCCKTWFNNLLQRREHGELNVPAVNPEGVSFVSGNCFNIDVERAVSSCRYDRIYVGAGCPEARKEFFLSLLADDGVMVASINEKSELIKIRRTHRNMYSESHISQVIFAPLIEPPPDEEAYELRPPPRERLNSLTSLSSTTTTEDGTLTLSSSPTLLITFSSSPNTPSPLRALMLLPHAEKRKIRLPPLLWNATPSRHRQFSRAFKKAVFTILLFCRYPREYSRIRQEEGWKVTTITMCNCSKLPQTIWVYILSFASRDWFVPAPTPLTLLQDELLVEKTLRHAAEQRAREEEQRRRRSERERDVYKMLIRRMSAAGADLLRLRYNYSDMDEDFNDEEDEHQNDAEAVDAMEEEVDMEDGSSDEEAASGDGGNSDDDQSANSDSGEVSDYDAESAIESDDEDEDDGIWQDTDGEPPQQYVAMEFDAEVTASTVVITTTSTG